MVKDKKFPYTSKGKKQAKEYAKMMAPKPDKKPAKK